MELRCSFREFSFCLSIAQSSDQLISTIINSFGHPPAISQLLTVPPYVVASECITCSKLTFQSCVSNGSS